MSTPQDEQPKPRRERKWPLKIAIPPQALGARRYLREMSPIPADPAPESQTSPAPPPQPSTAFDRTRLRPPDFARHSRRCNVCSHPDRDIIEAEFIRWSNPDRLAEQFNLGHRSSIYRHAHATGLFERRRRELLRVLESILEAADFANFQTADVLIRATRVYAHLDDNGYWYEPPKTVTVLHGPAPAAAANANSRPSLEDTSPEDHPAPEAPRPSDPEILIATASETGIPVNP